MIGASVDVRFGWGEELIREKNDEVRAAVAIASEDGAKTAAAIAERRRRSPRGDSMADIEPIDVVGVANGWEGGFRSPKFYAPFQSAGTLASRRKPVKQSTRRRRESASGQARLAKLGSSGGIQGLGFLEAGDAAQRDTLIAILNTL